MKAHHHPDHVIEVGHHQSVKDGQTVCGDTFLSRRLKAEGRTLSILSDGLGSGVKAGVLSTLTTSMAFHYMAGFRDIRRTAETILNTLPVCSRRKVSYATFTIADIQADGQARMVEYDTPPYLLLRGGRVVPVPVVPMEGVLASGRPYQLRYSELAIHQGDRLLFFSDGVSQAGMGMSTHPLGWGWNPETVASYVEGLVASSPDISAADLARKVVEEALFLDRGQARDDISCAAVYYRRPRQLLLMTGPPMRADQDRELAQMLLDYPGRKVICGGTTAKIVARELQRRLEIDLGVLDPQIPPGARLDGVDLVTEGIMTLSALVRSLEEGVAPGQTEHNPARRLLQMLEESDVIELVLGTRINEAHQDPNVPLELGIRRNIVRRLVELLEQKYLKEVCLTMV